MNIAIVASAFYPSLGGVEEMCRQFAHALKRLGHGVIVVTNRWPRDLPRHEVYEGIDVYRLPFRVPIGRLKADLRYWATRGLTRRETTRVLRRHRIDVVHVHCVSSAAMYARHAADELGLPFVVTLHGELTMDAGGVYRQEGIGRDIMRMCLQTADAISACSCKSLSEAEEFIGHRLENGRVIYNGVRGAELTSSAPFKRPRPYVLGIGRHVPQKGFDLLLRAFASSTRALNGLDLVLAGDGPETTSLRGLAAELGVEHRVWFFGRADRQQAASLFNGCEFVAVPSRNEPFGIVCLEAMACGKPVVAANVGGIPEFVCDRENGILVKPDSVSALADALEEVAVNGELRSRLAAGGWATAARFDWAAIARQYLSLYVPARSSTELASESDRLDHPVHA